MYAIIVFSCLLATVCAQHNCGNDVLRWCGNKAQYASEEKSLPHCSTTYGHIQHLNVDLQQYVSLHINTSFKYLLMSSHFGGFMKNREGLEKTFRRLSDSMWEDAIDLIKYMNKRGLSVELSSEDPAAVEDVKGGNVYSKNELESLGNALDYQKVIAKKAINIHARANEPGKKDPEVASYLENNFLHRHADVIRNLAGLVSDLKKFSSSKLSSLSYFIFDEYLQK